MSEFNPQSALIVGAGTGLSASIARLLSSEGMKVSLAARDTSKLAGLCSEIGAEAYRCDASDPQQVAVLFSNIDKAAGSPDVVIYNPSARERGPIADLDPENVKQALLVTGYGGFLVGQQAARRMASKGAGVILFTGASASIKGYAQSASFAMGKFALRGLAQSMARELQPKGVHVAHINIDGGIRNPERRERMPPADRPDSMLDPDEIAKTYLHLIRQHRSAWTMELEVRPWLENF
ncbi:MAG: SDR family NAD(P)-dependent oxidoreductase [Rhizobiales bacterium]|nr:SDR family NAD(P)-dependent oxidoreductase [Hyphomicrobiales bacterium]